MATLQQIRKAVEKHGGTLTDSSAGRYKVFHADLPPGKCWYANGLHVLTMEWRAGEPEYRKESLEDILERIGYGVGTCGDDECEWCHPVEEAAQ